jgi:type I restriction enzyme, S subunit
MIEDLNPYPEYKDSGLPWLGDVPEHWQIVRIKTVLQETDRRSQDGAETLLSLTRIRGLIPHRDMTKKMHGAKTLVGYKKYRAGQLVMNRMQAWSGMFGTGKVDGLVSPDYAVFDVLGEHSVHFVLERIKSPDLVGQFALESKGIGSGFNRLYTDGFGQIAISLPPTGEQGAIARFLAWATNRLDRAIGSKRRIIALLQEQKQAIIHRAVTRGLDPSVPLKDSGIPWLGEIPEHWEVRRTKQLCLAIIDCKNRTPELVEEGEFSVVRTTNIRNGEFNPRGSYSTDRRNFEIWTQRGAPKLGDVFFTREAPVGEACLVPDRIDLCMGQRMMYFRPDPDVLDAGFILNSIYGPVVRKYIEIQVNGSTVGHLRLGQVSALPLLWCPVTEQKAIVAHIDKLSAPMATAISRLEQEITLLREYRTRLVADVVTGKLDVREVAAELPEEIQSDDVQDATEEDLDLDAEDEVPENLA